MISSNTLVMSNARKYTPITNTKIPNKVPPNPFDTTSLIVTIFSTQFVANPCIKNVPNVWTPINVISLFVFTEVFKKIINKEIADKIINDES